MIFDIEVNSKKYQAKKGETILEALNKNGIKVPTLCKMEGFSPTGACRMCVVEVEGREGLITSCSNSVEEWMKIKTHSPRVIKARRTIVELLLANHPDDCLYCVRNGLCELQDLAVELNIRERLFFAEKKTHKKDKSSPGIERDPEKCILCGRCVRVCEEQENVSAIDFINRGKDIFIGTTFQKGLNLSSCVNCGQCILVCPTGALHERFHIAAVTDALNNPKKHVVAHFAPSVTVSIAEEFGLKPGKDMSGILTAVLRRLGFDKVFDTAFASDMGIIEESKEFLKRHEEGKVLPMLSSCCPSWVQYIEEFYPEIIPNLSTTKSPQQILGSLIKTFYAEKSDIATEDIFNVSIMPCTAKKFEAQREEHTHEGITDTDAVLTTRELIQLIHLYGLDLDGIEPEYPDEPFAIRSSAGKIFGTIGGISESLIRTIHYYMLDKDIKDYKITSVRNVKDYKVIQVKIGKETLNFGIASGLNNVSKVLDDIKAGNSDLHFVEVMACPGGCINGGGQFINSDDKKLKARIKGLYEIDDSEMIKRAHKNATATKIYDEYLGKPLSEKCMSVLHTSYSQKDVFL